MGQTAKRVLVGMSGGVDSTLTTYLMQQEGYHVEGVYLKLFDNSGYHDRNIEKVRRVAEFLNIPYHVLDLSDAFRAEVYEPFVNAYVEGRTPNPCGLCNRFIKFGRMLEFADTLGCDYLATGHYIRTDGTYLYEAEDKSKDQSYFTFYVRPEVLKRAIFPLGSRVKEGVKEMVSQFPPIKDLAYQKESSEICFVDETYKEILSRHVNVDDAGQVLSLKGEVIGTHKGYMNYTVGQRRGFDVPQIRKRFYINKILPESNQIIVGSRDDMARTRIRIGDLNLFDPKPSFEATVKIRYRTHKLPCKVEVEGDEAVIYLEEPAYAVAAGQAAVFYEGERVLGGGWIVE